MHCPVLILGGTAEARALAARLTTDGVPVTSSLAGRVSKPRLPNGQVRVGGFGGPDAMAAWLTEQGVKAVVDATHPFAERISANAARATTAAGVPLLRLERPGWTEPADARWHWADDLDHAAALLGQLGTRAFLTTGRQGLAAFAELPVYTLIRCVEQPDPPLPANSDVILSRGPYEVDSERELMKSHGIDVLATKNSGGTMTVAKLEAARGLGIPVVVVRRPPRPATTTVSTVDEAAAWVHARVAS